MSQYKNLTSEWEILPTPSAQGKRPEGRRELFWVKDGGAFGSFGVEVGVPSCYVLQFTSASAFVG